MEQIPGTIGDFFKNRKVKKCPFCKKDMSNPTFKDSKSKKEFEISGLCQDCQDDVF